MSVRLLLSPQALTPGSNLWVVPPPINSLWSRKLDWYLNFRVASGLSHRSQRRSLPLESILRDVQWSLPAFVQLQSEPVLVAASRRLPCDWVLILEQLMFDPPSLKSSLRLLAKIWEDLKHPSLRLFAPSGLSHGALTELWHEHLLPEDFELVLE